VWVSRGIAPSFITSAPDGGEFSASLLAWGKPAIIESSEYYVTMLFKYWEEGNGVGGAEWASHGEEKVNHSL
jgi:hypothetical protein